MFSFLADQRASQLHRSALQPTTVSSARCAGRPLECNPTTQVEPRSKFIVVRVSAPSSDHPTSDPCVGGLCAQHHLPCRTHRRGDARPERARSSVILEETVMATVGPSPTSAAPAPGTSFVEWGAVFAGAVLAAAISFVLLTFGTAIGLSATSPWPNSGLSAKVVASLAILWALMQQIGAFMAGGYVAGRMRSRWRETGDEFDFRDGLHGGLVWAVGVTIGALIFLSTAGAVARSGAEVAGQAGAAAAASTNDPMGAVIDTMLRPANLAQATTPPAPAAGTQATAPTAGQAARPRPATAPGQADEQRAEIARLMATATTSESMSAQDRAYLAQLVAQRTALTQQEAERRVNDAILAARQAADKARRAAILTGFVTAAGLMISFAAAWWAAVKGGNHRDNSVPARFDFTDRRRTVTPSSGV